MRTECRKRYPLTDESLSLIHICQVIRVEYGDYGNWQKFCVEKVRPSGSKVVADVCSSGGYSFKTDFSFRMDEEVDVVEGGAEDA